MNVEEGLAQLLECDRRCRQQERELLEGGDAKALAQALRQATKEAQATATGQEDLPRLIGLWGQLGSSEALTALFDLLLSDNAVAQTVAGEELIELANENFKLFKKEAEKRLADEGPFDAAIEGLAVILTECRDEGTVDLVLTMLGHKDAFVALAALEIAGEWGWEGTVQKAIARLKDDRRRLTLDDEEEGPVEVSLGELATQIHDSLRAALKGQRR
jgi:hypothetical protein